jgi:hAT family C-terminal dimerisation region
VNLLQIWDSLNTGKRRGRNQLVKLAICILTVVANSAGCERLFSKMGLIHSKVRNRLGTEKVRDMAVLKTELQREHVTEGLSRKRLRKRKFGEMGSSDLTQSSTGLSADEEIVAEAEKNETEVGQDGDGASNAAVPSNDSTLANFTRIAQGLIDDSDEEGDSDNEDTVTAGLGASAAPPSRRHIICYFGRQ